MDFASFLNQLRETPLILSLPVAAAVWILLLGHDRCERLSLGWKRGLLLLAVVVAGGGMLAALAITATKIVRPPEWDFLCYWVFGQALAAGSNPYDPAVLRELATPLETSDTFRRELFCMYPPPCVVQFWPLGWFSVRTAAAMWFVVQWLAAGGIVFGSWRLLDSRRSWTGLLIAAALVFSLRSTWSTCTYAQSNFLIVGLAFVMLFAASPWLKGIAVGLATVVKPLGAILALDLLARRDWKGLLGISIPLIATTAIYVANQGTEGLDRYRQREVMPTEIREVFFTETTNTSLLAVLLRQTGTSAGEKPLFFPPFVILAGGITLLSLVILVRLPRELALIGPGYSLAVGLLIYPGTLFHYSVAILVPLIAGWGLRHSLPGGRFILLVAFPLCYALVWEQQEFAANLCCWLALTVLLGRVAFVGRVTSAG